MRTHASGRDLPLLEPSYCGDSSLKSKTLSVKKKCCMLVIVAYVESSSSIYIYIK